MGQLVIRRLLTLFPSASWLFLPFGLLACLALAGTEVGPRPHIALDRSPRPSTAGEQLLSWGAVTGISAIVPLSFVSAWLRRRKKRPKVLQEPVKILERALKDAPLAYWAIDSQGILTFCEGRGLRRLVPNHEQLVGQPIDGVFPHVPAFAENHRRVLAGEEFSSVVAVSPDEILEIWYQPIRNAHDRIIGARGVAIDITKRKQAEHELQRKHQFVESLIQAAPAIVLVLDSEGRILRCNPCLEKLTGYQAEELHGRDWFTTFLPNADRPQARACYSSLISGQAKGPNGTGVTTLITKDGEPRQVEWNHQVLCDDQGNALGVLAVGQDVTALYEARTRAVQAERLAAIGEMVTGLAHESGNALQRIQACLEMLALQVQDRPAALDLVYRIQIAQDHLHQLYEEVRQYAAPIVLRREPAHVSDLLQQAWEHLEPVHAGRVVEFVNQVHTNYVCRVDRYAMERVFRNILENALAAVADPVRIEVLWRDAALGEQPAVEIRLRDNGPGLNPEQKKRIFEPFYTTKTQSTGLGMAITKRLVEAHGGRIAVGDQFAGGAEIVVILPKE